MDMAKLNTEISVCGAADLLGCSRTWIKTLERDGHLRRTDGKLHQVDLIRDYLRWLKDAGRRANQSASANRLAEARAEEIEQRVAARSATLIHSADVLAALREVLAVLQSELVGLPARATKDLALRRKLGDELDAVLMRGAAKIDAFAASVNLAEPPAQKRASRREAQIRG